MVALFLWRAAALVALFASHALAATQLPCPRMDCVQNGTQWYVMGKFIDPNDPRQEASDLAGGILRTFFFEQDDFPRLFRDINGGKMVTYEDAYRACAQVCEIRYNAAARASAKTISGFWMFENTCEDGPGGQCRCMSSEVCPTGAPGSGTTGRWSDEWHEGWQYGAMFQVPTDYTTGRVCSSNFNGDPHFTGFDGSHFDFSGVPNHTFAIVSDAHVQVNAYFGGRWGQWDNRVKALTWIRKVTVLWGHHVAELQARIGPDADYGEGYMASITVDGEPLDVAPHGTAATADGRMSVTWEKVKERESGEFVDEYLVSVEGILKMRLLLRPELRNLRTKDDAVVHFNMKLDSARLSSNAHGVLGQTYRPDFAGRLAQQDLVWSPTEKVEVVPGDNAEGFLDGGVEDYMVKDMYTADCRFCRFARETSVDEETARALAMSADQMFLSRKLLDASR